MVTLTCSLVSLPGSLGPAGEDFFFSRKTLVKSIFSGVVSLNVSFPLLL